MDVLEFGRLFNAWRPKLDYEMSIGETEE